MRGSQAWELWLTPRVISVCSLDGVAWEGEKRMCSHGPDRWMVLAPLILIGCCLATVRVLFPTAWMDAHEWITGDTPTVRARAYASALQRRDDDAALNLWELPAWDHQLVLDLARRREDITHQLIRANLQQDFQILHVEWWRTCCEPGVVHNAHEAGGARIQVQFLDQQGLPVVYTFDVFCRGGPYWGKAAGYPPRDWVLRDVYPPGEDPLFWRWVHEPQLRLLGQGVPGRVVAAVLIDQSRQVVQLSSAAG